MGYAVSHPVLDKGLRALDAHWGYERNGARFIQASESPIWDTLLTLLAFHDAEEEYKDHEAMQKAVAWILDQQVLVPGDWAIKVKGVKPGGWAFERANLMYPDVDDTAVALIVLALIRDQYPDKARLDEAMALGRDWVLAMQCSNGGWAAFDKDNDKDILTKIPFSDFGETLDPPSVDVTAHVLEAFGLMAMPAEHPAIQRGLAYLRDEQEECGSWFGRWGVNHIYGTAAVLPALHALGLDMDQQWIRDAADWVAQQQNEDGGWGESCASYMNPDLIGQGTSTASQTGWALMALIATHHPDYCAQVEQGRRLPGPPSK